MGYFCQDESRGTGRFGFEGAAPVAGSGGRVLQGRYLRAGCGARGGRTAWGLARRRAAGADGLDGRAGGVARECGGALARCAVGHHARRGLYARERSARRAGAARPGGGQRLCPGEGLPRSGQAAAQAAWALADRGGGRRDQGVCRYRSGDGETAGAGGRAGLAGQAHQSAEPRPWQLVLPGGDLHHAGAAARRGGGGALRQLHRLPRHLPDEGVPGAVPTRCAALHFLPDDRASTGRWTRACAP